ncbi:MAG: heparinase II/III family protein [Clostridia bacterium]|nr:heparinase II/III family protein [Clostridia bacterium]
MLGEYLNVHPLRQMVCDVPVCLYPPMEDRDAWSAVDVQDREELLALYASLRDTPYPILTASQFMAFVQTGSRAVFETPYFLRRRKLIASVLHMCLTGTDDALSDVIDGVWCICEESSWVISAHNVNPIPGGLRPADRPLPEMEDRYIDLFAAQTAMILSQVSCLVGAALDRAAPVLRRRISREIEERILTPFMTRDDFWWMGFIRKDLCNWTPWIVSNVLYTAAAQMHDRLRFAALADRACRMLDRWLDVMPQDGGCDEGTAYYNMAGGSMFDCLELMERMTQGQMTLWHEEKIANILSFPLRTQLEHGWFVNFADCDARPFLCGERLQAAGEKLGDSRLIRMGCALRGTPGQQIADVPHFTRLLSRLFSKEAASAADAPAARDVWLPDLQLRIYEHDGLILCAKGGHNGEAHNHNDVGSFMLYADGEPAIVDAGNMTYTAKTFSDERYTLFNTRSAYHNLPLIGGHEQQPGSGFAAADVQRLDDGLALELAGAYGAEAGVVSCRRSLRLQDALTLHDSVTLGSPAPVEWVFMLRSRPVCTADGVDAGAVRIRHGSALTATAEEIPVTDARMAKCFPGSLWRLVLRAAERCGHDETFIIERISSHE